MLTFGFLGICHGLGRKEHKVKQASYSGILSQMLLTAPKS